MALTGRTRSDKRADERSPGAGYFRIAGEGHDGEDTFDPKVNWEADLQAVFDYWSTH